MSTTTRRWKPRMESCKRFTRYLPLVGLTLHFTTEYYPSGHHYYWLLSHLYVSHCIVIICLHICLPGVWWEFFESRDRLKFIIEDQAREHGVYFYKILLEMKCLSKKHFGARPKEVVWNLKTLYLCPQKPSAAATAFPLSHLITLALFCQFKAQSFEAGGSLCLEFTSLALYDTDTFSHAQVEA